MLHCLKVRLRNLSFDSIALIHCTKSELTEQTEMSEMGELVELIVVVGVITEMGEGEEES